MRQRAVPVAVGAGRRSRPAGLARARGLGRAVAAGPSRLAAARGGRRPPGRTVGHHARPAPGRQPRRRRTPVRRLGCAREVVRRLRSGPPGDDPGVGAGSRRARRRLRAARRPGLAARAVAVAARAPRAVARRAAGRRLRPAAQRPGPGRPARPALRVRRQPAVAGAAAGADRTRRAPRRPPVAAPPLTCPVGAGRGRGRGAPASRRSDDPTARQPAAGFDGTRPGRAAARGAPVRAGRHRRPARVSPPDRVAAGPAQGRPRR